jgi:diacylglycerol kinase family enzyme
MHIGVITNPHSRKNKGRPNRARELQSIVGELGEVHSTDNVDSIKPILREFLRRRARFWVADGGDGALHWMVRKGFEVLQEDEFRGQDVALPLTVPTNGGTIDFVAQNVGIKGKAEEILTSLRGLIETGQSIEEVEVDSMIIEGLERTPEGATSFRTYGFASAAGGVGQRFYSKYYEDADPNPRTIVKVASRAVASMPFAFGPLKQIPGLGKLGSYARDMFQPTRCKVTIDGMVLPHDDYTGVHVAAMSINLGGVFRFFNEADRPGLLHCLVGAPSPFAIAMNLPQMHLGKQIRGDRIVDRACRELTMEATGPELLSPIVDGEFYRNLEKISFRVGPRVRIPKVIGRSH